MQVLTESAIPENSVIETQGEVPVRALGNVFFLPPVPPGRNTVH